jgi:hypothetical protein
MSNKLMTIYTALLQRMAFEHLQATSAKLYVEHVHVHIMACATNVF